MTQVMKLLLAGAITGVVMMTAAIGTATAAGPSRAPYLVPVAFELLARSLHIRNNSFKVRDRFVFDLVALCVVSPLRPRGGDCS